MAEFRNENDLLRKLSLALFGNQVVVSLKTDSDAFARYGHLVSGKLTGRVWGELSSDDGTSNSNTVVALILILSDSTEITIPCQDIIKLSASSGENQAKIC